MQFETVMLKSLFAACLLLCVAVLGAMLALPATTARSLAAQPASATTSASPHG